MPISAVVAGLLITLAPSVGPAAPTPDRVAPAQRIARAETDLCLPRCPSVPADPSSEWLRSQEGRDANRCILACSVDPPAASLFQRFVAQATSPGLDPESPSVRAIGKGAPGLMRRLHLAVSGAQGRRLGRLCERARESAGRPAELGYLECTGRRPRQRDAGPLPAPDPLEALTCAVAFMESEADWLSRCPALEKRTEADIEACARPAGAPPGSRSRCEREGVAGLARAMGRPPR